MVLSVIMEYQSMRATRSQSTALATLNDRCGSKASDRARADDLPMTARPLKADMISLLRRALPARRQRDEVPVDLTLAVKDRHPRAGVTCVPVPGLAAKDRPSGLMIS